MFLREYNKCSISIKCFLRIMPNNSCESKCGADEMSGACSRKEVILSGRFKTVRARTVLNKT